MATNHGYGEAVFPEPVPMPELVFDAAKGRTGNTHYGRGEFAEHVVLPELVFDAAESFVLNVVPPPTGATAEEVAADLAPLFALLNQYEIELGGTGITLDFLKSNRRGLAWRVSANEPAGAVERLQALRGAFNRERPLPPPSEIAARVRTTVDNVPHQLIAY